MQNQIIEGYQLSPQQERLWRLQQLHTRTPYVTAASIWIEGRTDNNLLKAAVESVIEQHEILHTSFPTLPEMSIPLQVPDSDVVIWDSILDFSGLSSQIQKEDLEIQWSEMTRMTFDWERGPLVRLRLIVLAPEVKVLLISLSSLCADLTSLNILVKEIGSQYAALTAGEKLTTETTPYAVASDWLNELLTASDSAVGRDYWRSLDLSGLYNIKLPIGRKIAGPQDFTPDSFAMPVSSDLFRQIEDCARTYNCSMEVFLLACWQTLLWRLCGETEVVVGTALNGRTDEELEQALGLLTRYAPICSRFRPSDNFSKALDEIKTAFTKASAWQECFSWDQIGATGQLTVNPYLPLCFEFSDSSVETAAGAVKFSLKKSVAQIDQFEVKLTCVRGQDGLLVELHYDSALYSPDEVRSLAEYFHVWLGAVSRRPETELGDLEVVGEEEKLRQVIEFNCTDIDFQCDLTLIRLFESQVKRTPGRVAVVFESQTLTYADLNARVNQLAHYLQKCGVGPEVKVAICLERCFEMVIGLLATLKAGGAYIPIDPAYPEDRVAFMLADSGAQVLLTQQELAQRLPAEGTAHTICLDAEWDRISQESVDDCMSTATGDNIAYIIYTSGSTGRPKGVMIPDRALVNHMLWMQHQFPMTEADCVLQKTPFSFDASVWEFYAPLLCGARLVMARPGGHKQADYMIDVILDQGVTILQLVPTLLRMLLDEPEIDQCTSLRRVFCGGEPLMADLVQRFFDKLNAELHNLYGPTEATIDAVWWRCRRDKDEWSIPIGRPIANSQAFVLNHRLHPAPLGVPAELYLSGVNLARGYLNRPDLTAAKFIPNVFSREPGGRLYRTGDLVRLRPEGIIEYRGRIDHQVKIRGSLVELGEVEAVLCQSPLVSEACVIDWKDDRVETRLAAFYVPAPAERPTVELLREYLMGKLPDYMVPAYFIPLKRIPLTPNGKLDRQALKMPDNERPELGKEYIAPRNEVEELLAAIWSQVLGVEKVGIDDNFFALGGDSIRSVQVVALAKQRGLDCSVQKLFEHQTILQLARELGRIEEGAIRSVQTKPFDLVSDADRRMLPADVEDAYPLTMLQKGMLYHMELDPNTPIYHNVSSWNLRAHWDQASLQTAVGRAVARHPNLRTYFDLVHYSEPLQIVNIAGFLPVEVEDLRHLSPAMQNEYIDAYVASESKHFFDISKPPLLRLHIHRLADDTFQFTLTEFHPIFDGWSLTSTLAEIFHDYFAQLNNKPLEEITRTGATSFRDYVKLERLALESEECKNFWEDKLRDSTPLILPRWPSLVQNGNGQRMHHKIAGINGSVLEGLRKLSLAAAVPFKHVLLASHVKVMSVVSGRTDVLTGLSANNTRPEEIGGDQLRGLFINTVPFRMKLKSGSWIDLVREAFAVERELLPYRLYPFAALQMKSGFQRLVETSFNYVHFHSVKNLFESGNLEIAGPGRAVELSSFTLQVNFSLAPVNSHLKMVLSCDASQICEEQAQILTDCYQSVLAAMAADPAADHMCYQPVKELTDNSAPSIDGFAESFNF